MSASVRGGRPGGEPIASGDAGLYFAILTPDAVFMPPNSMPKSGDELRQWRDRGCRRPRLPRVHLQLESNSQVRGRSEDCTLQRSAHRPPAARWIVETQPQHLEPEPGGRRGEIARLAVRMQAPRPSLTPRSPASGSARSQAAAPLRPQPRRSPPRYAQKPAGRLSRSARYAPQGLKADPRPCFR